MKNYISTPEIESFFESLTEFPAFLNTEMSIVKNPKVAVTNHLATINKLLDRHGKPRIEGTPTEKNAWNVMIKRKARLIDIMNSIQDKSNWMNELPKFCGNYLD